MSKNRLLTFGLFAAVCLLAIPLLAIGMEGSSESAQVAVAERDEEGKELFADNCGTCHTLAAAGTEGVVGPNLDDRLAPGGNGSFEASYPRALNAVTCGFGEGRMPAGILTGEDAKEVSAFVGAYAGQLGTDDEPLVNTDTAELADAGPCGGDSAGSEESDASDPEADVGTSG